MRKFLKASIVREKKRLFSTQFRSRRSMTVSLVGVFHFKCPDRLLNKDRWLDEFKQDAGLRRCNVVLTPCLMCLLVGMMQATTRWSAWSVREWKLVLSITLCGFWLATDNMHWIKCQKRESQNSGLSISCFRDLLINWFTITRDFGYSKSPLS